MIYLVVDMTVHDSDHGRVDDIYGEFTNGFGLMWMANHVLCFVVWHCYEGDFLDADRSMYVSFPDFQSSGAATCCCRQTIPTLHIYIYINVYGSGQFGLELRDMTHWVVAC